MTTPSSIFARRPHQIADCVAAFLQSGDLAGIVSMFHPECQISFPPDQPPSVGHDGVRRVFEDFVALRPILKSEVTSEVIIGDTALLHAAWSLWSQDGPLIAEGSSTEVARKLENGGWVYLIDCPLGAPVLRAEESS